MTQLAAMPQGLRRQKAARLLGTAGQVIVVVLLGIAFFLAPALQGINLQANQADGVNAAMRAADTAASAEAARLSQAN